MASIVKVATGYRVQLDVKGQRESKTLPTKREAQEWAAKREIVLRATAGGNVGAVKTLKDALHKYADEVSPHRRGWQKEMIRLKAFERHPDLPIKKRMHDITPADIAAWRDARLRMNARGSVLRDIGLLSAVMETARREWGWIEKNPVKDVRKPANPDHRDRLITLSETRRMLRQLGHGGPVRTVSQAVAMCFLVALRTGMRAGELCALAWTDVFADYCTVTAVRVGAGKTGKRDVPLTPRARRLIERMRGWDDELVFGLKSQSLDALFRKARGRAGLEGFTFHDARHTAATMMARKINVLELCRVFGWVKTDQALTYFNASASDIAVRLA